MRIDNSTPVASKTLASVHEHLSTCGPRAPPVAPSPGCSIAESVATSAGSRRSRMHWVKSRTRS